VRPPTRTQEAALSGTPIIRPLFYDFWDDAGAQDVDDQQMFGPDYLVAPVLSRGALQRVVYLPRLPMGQLWVHMFTRVATNTSLGGFNVTEPTPLDEFPVYQRVTITDDGHAARRATRSERMNE
jgi:alpha-D-xyloside xylohydrolase